MMWTTAVLSLLMPPDEAETVAGDLIEEYRDTVYPAVGKWRADLWLARQVAGFVWRVPLVWGLLVALFIAGRFVADTFAPPASYAARSFFTTWSSILLYLIAGAWGARRTGRLRTGVLLAAGAHAIGWAISGVVTIALFAGRDPQPARDAEPVLRDGRLGGTVVSPADAASRLSWCSERSGAFSAGRSAAARGPDYQSAYLVLSSAVASDPLLTS